MKQFRYLLFLLTAMAGVLLLSTPFVESRSLVNGLVIGKVRWFQLVMPLFSICTCLLALTGKKDFFKWSLPDTLVLLYMILTLATYDWGLNPEPEKLMFGGQLVIFWFLLRWLFNAYPVLKPLFIFTLMCTGLAEALLGLGQLHGEAVSNHSLFRLTGTFYNPGPFSGYIAVILPVCLSVALYFRLAARYFAWICIAAIMMVLPAGMSRSAWLAAAFSCAMVYWVQEIGWDKTKRVFIKYHKASFLLIAGAAIILTGAAAGMYNMKQDSANGRLLMWKVTGKAIAGKPITGHGLGGFPGAYREAQAHYFATGTATETEKRIAGCPEYAFNEYLQIASEQGIFALLIFLIWLGIICYQGLKNKQTGMVGGIVALIVFAFSSYPLQLPSFWILLISMGTIATYKKKYKNPDSQSETIKSGKTYITMGYLCLLTSISGCLFWIQKDFYHAYKEWNRVKISYNSHAYSSAIETYNLLYPKLKHKPEFLFEAAQCKGKTEDYAGANKLLDRAVQLSADPMLYYIIAKNEQNMGHYQKAEYLLLHAIDILPERIYPYYLLCKLYAEPDFYQDEKMQAAVHAVLTKEPKVNSRAIQEMREESKKILKAREKIRCQALNNKYDTKD